MNECIECGKKCSGKRCMECFKKTQEIKIGDYTFVNKKELKSITSMQLKQVEYNIEFNNPLFELIVNELHEEVKKRNLKCTKFKVLNWYGQNGEWEYLRNRFRGGIFVVGFFEPINKWHGVTLFPYKTTSVKQKLVNALRQKWSEQAEQREPNAVCEICGNPNPQLHHDNLEFKDIFEKCLPYFSEKELAEGIGDDWWWHESEADAIPNDHPAVIQMLELHKDVKYKWLCWKCHKKTF